MQLPWRAAPRAAASGPLTVVVTVVAATLLSFVAAASVLHADTAGSAAIAYQASRLCPQTLPAVVDANQISPTDAATVLAAARDTAPRHGFDTVVGGLYSPVRGFEFAGTRPWSRFGYRDGAMDHLDVLEGGGRDGLWVPRSIADDAGIKLGDRGLGGSLPPVTAIYRDPTTPVADYWCSEQQRILPNPLAAEGSTAAVIWFPDLPTYTRHVTAVTGDAGALTIRFPTALPTTVDAAADQVARGRALLADLTAAARADGLDRRLLTATYFAKPVDVARASATTVRDAVLPLTLISLIVGLAGVAAVAVQWCQRRHAEVRLLWSRGAGPAAIACRAIGELAAPLLAGAAAGLTTAHAALPWYAPSTTLTDGTATRAVLLVAAVAAAAVTTIAATVALRAHRTLQSAGRPRRRWARWVPWELLTATLAYLAWAHLRANPTRLEFGQPLPRTADAIALAYPLLVVLTVALATVRLSRWGLAASHRLNLWRAPALQLAVRRLAAAAGSAVGILLVGVLAVGTLTVGTGIAAAQRHAMDLKSGLFVGAESTAQIPRTAAQAPLPPDLAATSTVVGVHTDPTLTVLAVDRATLTRTAHLAQDPDDIDALLDRLDRPGAALRVGNTPDGDRTIPDLGAVHPVAHVTSFPLIGTGRGYVVARDHLPDGAAFPMWQVWSTDPLPTLRARLDAAGIDAVAPRAKDRALDGLPFLTVIWTFDFVTALGVVLAVVAAAALALAVEVRRRHNAVAGALARRMGLRRRTLIGSHLAELGGLAGICATAGAAAGAACTAVAAPLLDPSPWLRPAATTPNLLPILAGTAAVTAVVVAIVCHAAVRSVTTARIGELIRG